MKIGKKRLDLFTGTCPGCGTAVECAPREARYVEGDRPIDPGAYFVACPECDDDIFLLPKIS